MKKIFSFVIVLAAVAMVSCGGNTGSQAVETVEATEVVVEEAVPAADTTACCQADSTAVKAVECETK